MTDYQTAYAILEKNAQLLEKGDKVSIDELVDVVNESIKAYKTCKERIDAVEQALTQSFAESAKS